MLESIGKRIAYLRQKNGWTQQSLANRLAMSRVAISHIEMDLTIPSERSITLMAGLFKLSPLELVEGTSYPKAKAERLPEVANIATNLELLYQIQKNDAEWLARLDHSTQVAYLQQEILAKWSGRIEEFGESMGDEHEIQILQKMRQLLKEMTNQFTYPRA
jgi:transcriptional regulator with XRE-family HTH domain